MTPASWPREDIRDGRVLCVDPVAGNIRDARLADLPGMLRAGDVLVANDAATLPASLHGTTGSGEALEVRLAGRGVPSPARESAGVDRTDDGADLDEVWSAVLFGAGDWRTRTEDRPPPPALATGDAIRFGDRLAARVVRVHPASARLVDLRFDRSGESLWQALYAHGRPVQYSYVRHRLDLWHVQTAYGSRPWALETPSAGRPLTWDLLFELVGRGVRLTHVTHAAGLSSTGDAAADALLPLPERFSIPEATARTVRSAKAAGSRVIAVGTTVVRALEGGAALHGAAQAGEGVTDLRIGAGYRPSVVDGLLTGIHEPGTSHFSLLTAFAPEHLLLRAHEHAERTGYFGHEFGDSSLVLAA